MNPETKYFFARVKEIHEEDRTLEAVASTSDLDRDNEMIQPSAFLETLDSFKANPVVLAEHQHQLSSGSSPVIGSVIPETIRISDEEVSFKMRFADTPLGNEYWQLYKDKHQRAFSIGFIPLEGEFLKDKQGRKYAFVHTKLELLEISAVPVPSNRRALARAKGFYDLEEKNDLLRMVLESWQHEIAELGSLFNQLKEALAKDINQILTDLNDIKTILDSESHRFAEALFGSPDDPPDAAGDKETAERISQRLQEATMNLD